jgi:hypothetical protein
MLIFKSNLASAAELIQGRLQEAAEKFLACSERISGEHSAGRSPRSPRKYGWRNLSFWKQQFRAIATTLRIRSAFVNLIRHLLPKIFTQVVQFALMVM